MRNIYLLLYSMIFLAACGQASEDRFLQNRGEYLQELERKARIQMRKNTKQWQQWKEHYSQEK